MNLSGGNSSLDGPVPLEPEDILDCGFGVLTQCRRGVNLSSTDDSKRDKKKQAGRA
jgi:hypothetical protein